MVVNKKSVVERNRNVIIKKGRKISRCKDPGLLENAQDEDKIKILDAASASAAAGDDAAAAAADAASTDAAADDAACLNNSGSGSSSDELLASAKDDLGSDSPDCVSMESMVCLYDPAARMDFNSAILSLRHARFADAAKKFQDLLKHVQGLPSFGDYKIYKRTQNKKTTLSALFMFQALAYEGLSNPRKAIECCNLSISEDPGWPIPFSKRSEYFGCFEQYLLDTDGWSSDDLSKARSKADIIVSQSATKDKVGLFCDLQEALNAAKEGDTIFIENGFYFREEGYRVTCGCNIIGASSRACILVSKGNPTIQIVGGKGSSSQSILLSRLQFRNKISKPKEEDCSSKTTSNKRDIEDRLHGFESPPGPSSRKSSKNENRTKDDDLDEKMKSNAAHIFVISPENLTIRDCLFTGGDEESGGILIAEEAFYQSLLELEFQNPEYLQGCEKVSAGCIRILINSCIFSDCRLNPAIFANSQCTVILSNSWIYNCITGIRVHEGSTVSLLNSQISGTTGPCILVDTMATLNIRGSLIEGSAEKSTGVLVKGNSRTNIAKSLIRNHKTAVNCIESDLVFENNCVLDIGEEFQNEEIDVNGFELTSGAVCIRNKGNDNIKSNNFHNCGLVFLVQNGAEPTINDNNIEMCLIGIICGGTSRPKITQNIFQCILMSIGIFIEASTGTIISNIFRYVANGLDVYKSAAPCIELNVLEKLSLPGLTGSLSYDIQKVRSGKIEDMESCDVIRLTADTDQASANKSIQNRRRMAQRLRFCGHCGEERRCDAVCGACKQIFYCSDGCLSADKRRHANFCSLSLKDLL